MVGLAVHGDAHLLGTAALFCASVKKFIKCGRPYFSDLGRGFVDNVGCCRDFKQESEVRFALHFCFGGARFRWCLFRTFGEKTIESAPLCSSDLAAG